MSLYYMGIVCIEQDRKSIIFLSIYKKYWEIGFKTRLYDGLSPEAYLDSLRRASDQVKLGEREWVLDAGCGSGLLLSFLADRLAKGGGYLGMGILPAGLTSLKSRVKRWRPNRFAGMQADLSRSLPLADASVACVVAHFSVYTLPSKKSGGRRTGNSGGSLSQEDYWLPLIRLIPTMACRVFVSAWNSYKGRGGSGESKNIWCTR